MSRASFVYVAALPASNAPPLPVLVPSHPLACCAQLEYKMAFDLCFPASPEPEPEPPPPPKKAKGTPKPQLKARISKRKSAPPNNEKRKKMPPVRFASGWTPEEAAESAMGGAKSSKRFCYGPRRRTSAGGCSAFLPQDGESNGK